MTGQSARADRGEQRGRFALADDARIAAVIGFTLAAIAVVVVNTNVPAGENGGTGPMIAGVLVSGAAALGLAVLLLSRTRHPGRSGIIVGLVGVISIAAYWSGLPFALGPIAIALGRRAGDRTGVAAQVLGAIAVLATIAVVIVDKS